MIICLVGFYNMSTSGIGAKHEEPRVRRLKEKCVHYCCLSCHAEKQDAHMNSQGQLLEAMAAIQAILIAASTQHITTIHRIISLTNTARECNERTTPNTYLNRKRRKARLSAEVCIECSPQC